MPAAPRKVPRGSRASIPSHDAVLDTRPPSTPRQRVQFALKARVQQTDRSLRNRLKTEQEVLRGINQIRKLSFRDAAQEDLPDRVSPNLSAKYALQMWRSQRKAIEDLEDRVARADYTEILKPLDQSEIWKEVYASYKAQYAGLGPQYDSLVRRVATAEVACRSQEVGGTPLDMDFWMAQATEVRQTIAALQRYTEATKQEVLHAREQEAMRRILRIVERVVAYEQPELWERVIQEVSSSTQQQRMLALGAESLPYLAETPDGAEDGVSPPSSAWCPGRVAVYDCVE